MLPRIHCKRPSTPQLTYKRTQAEHEKCSGNQRKTVVIILPGETVTEIVIDLLVRIHISRELSVADGGCVGRIPKVSIYSFLHSFAHCTFLN